MMRMTLTMAALALCWWPDTAAAATANTVHFVLRGEASAAEAAALADAAAIANAVKNSDCFTAFIAGRKLVQTNGRPPAGVAQHLRHLSGQIPVAFYFRCMSASTGCAEPTQAIAYRQPPDPTIYLNRAYYAAEGKNFDLHEMAGSLAHEGFGHSLGGYDHSFDWTPSRDFSVPYSISGASQQNGDAFQACRSQSSSRQDNLIPRSSSSIARTRNPYPEDDK